MKSTWTLCTVFVSSFESISILKIRKFLKANLGNSLVVQWLGLRTFTAEGRGCGGQKENLDQTVKEFSMPNECVQILS